MLLLRNPVSADCALSVPVLNSNSMNGKNRVFFIIGFLAT